jgi:hypothetical protein
MEKSILNTIPDEVEDFLGEGDIATEFFHEAEWSLGKHATEENIQKFSPDGWLVRLVAHHGGEGQGDDYWTVVSFENDIEIVYVKFHGWYASYEGSTFEGFKCVQPIVRTVTFYE